jgi:hypothetical protein
MEITDNDNQRIISATYAPSPFCYITPIGQNYPLIFQVENVTYSGQINFQGETAYKFQGFNTNPGATFEVTAIFDLNFKLLQWTSTEPKTNFSWSFLVSGFLPEVIQPQVGTRVFDIPTVCYGEMKR